MKKILSIRVTASSFYKDLEISFSDKLNCIMGGRGAGKTTLLHFLKACLQKDVEKNKSIYNLLQENLGNGKIITVFETENGQEITVEKVFNELPLAYDHGEFVYFENLLSELQCDFYEAQAIEEIGRNGSSRLELIDKMIIGDVRELMNGIVDLQFEAHQNSYEIKSINSKIIQIYELSRNLDDVSNELENLKKLEPTGLTIQDKDDFEKAIENEKKRVSEKRYLEKLTAKNFEFLKTVSKIGEEIDEYLQRNLIPIPKSLSSVLNQTEIGGITSVSIDALSTIITKQKESIKIIAECIGKIQAASEVIKVKHEGQETELTKLKQRFEIHRDYINRYNSLSKQSEVLKNYEIEIRELESKRTLIKADRVSIIERLNQKKQQLFHKRATCANEINKTFNDAVKIVISFGGLKEEFELNLKEGLKGSGLRYNELIPKIIDNFTPDQFAKVINEKDKESLKLISGIDDIRSEALIQALYETDVIYFIESIYTPDLPDFLLKINKDSQHKSENYKKSDYLSMGQRCTAVLPIVFAVSNNPLIIDQPEDNLDNRYIYDSIHEIIRKQKTFRQLIFITHNANIPVLSESESNIFLAYDNKSEIQAQGSVDQVKEEIINLLEGGRDAFLRRKNTYGY